MTSPPRRPTVGRIVAPEAGFGVQSSELASRLGVGEGSLRAARWLAWRALRAGKLRRAADIAAGCVALSPSDAWSWRLLAEIRLRERRAAEAWRAADQAAAAGADPVWMGWLKARARILSGDFQGARQELQAARRMRGAPDARRAAEALLRRWAR